MRQFQINGDDLKEAENAGVLKPGQANRLLDWLAEREGKKNESAWSLRMLLLYVGLLALALSQWWLLAEGERQFGTRSSVTAALLLGFVHMGVAYVLRTSQLILAGLVAAIAACLIAVGAGHSVSGLETDSQWSLILSGVALALSALVQLSWIRFAPLSALVYAGVTMAVVVAVDLAFEPESSNWMSALMGAFALLWLGVALRVVAGYASWAHATAAVCAVLAVFSADLGEGLLAHLAYIGPIALLLLAARGLGRPVYLWCSLPLVGSYVSQLADRFLPEGIWSPLAVTLFVGAVVGLLLWRSAKAD